MRDTNSTIWLALYWCVTCPVSTTTPSSTHFLGKGFVVSGGTAALDSVVERKFKKKQELIEKNVAVIKAGWDYAASNGWGVAEKVKAGAATA